MTAELDDQQEKPNEEKVEVKTTESDDEKIQKIGEEEVEEVTENGSADKNESSDKPAAEEATDAEGQEADAALEDDTTVVVPRRKPRRFWERLFNRSPERHESPQDVEAGTELLAKDGNKIEIKEEDGKGEKNDSGTDVTVPITDDGDARNGKAKGKQPIARYSGPYWRRVAIFMMAIFLLLVVVTVVSLLTAGKNRGPMVEPIVVTDCGLVRGFIGDGIYVFRGIPYALPPTGEHRWKPPRFASELNECWSETYQAMNSSAFCYQKKIPGVELDMSEDCLYLDIITPSLSPPKRRPVVVYIPGDHPLEGYSAANLKWRPTTTLVDEKDVTFVTVNYRVGALGFLTLDLLTDSVRPPTSGNYGIMDMIAALKWVQRNIRVFGGDPAKVTVLAHGGGATAAIALLSSKKTEGLFSKMWLMSPAAYFSNQSLSEIGEANSGFLKTINCDSLDCLKNKSAEEVVAATPKSWDFDWSVELPTGEEEPSPVMTVVDGMVLYDTPQNVWRAGDINKVPVVIGSAAQESASSTGGPAELDNWTWTDFSDHVSEKLGPISTNLTVAAVEFYIHNSSTPVQQYHSMVSDFRTICPLERLTEALHDATEKDVFWYVIDYKPSTAVLFSNDSVATALSTHGLDIASIFGLLHRYITPMMPRDVTFQRNIQDLFYSFVNQGIPQVQQESLMASGFINIIGDQIRSRMTPYENCHVWDNADAYPGFEKTN